MSTTYANMGIKSWNSSSDFFSYTDLDSNWSKIDAHDHTSGKGVQIPTGGIVDSAVTAAKIAAGVIDNSKISASAGIVGSKLAANTITNDRIATADLQKLGLSDATIRRGKAVIATSESRTNTAFGLLTTPDRVQNIVLPTDGLLVFAYKALWQESVLGAARASFFVGSNQLATSSPNVAAAGQQASLNNSSGTAKDQGLYSCGFGLTSPSSGTVTANSTDSANAQVVGADLTMAGYAGVVNGISTMAGGLCVVDAPAGTYDISVQFKASSGSVTVKNRKLWVVALGF